MSGKIRCAIYTRKSSEEGLEQEFNSLDAQREACLAFVKSQQGMGWTALPIQYDDGGVSGGTIERPALKRLLADIESRKIDLVVVYKVDRLTRSLADFVKIVEVFDVHAVSFVSVTQQFNTSTSMGRLTLNMLLSFAQFEREVTGERIRDKVAASKKKGMWMGGPVPLGYEVRDKRLVVHAEEAATVRTLFRLYLKLGTVQKLTGQAKTLGLCTRRRRGPEGKVSGGLPFTRGHLYQLLSNPLYAGEVVHRDARYRGQHPPIVERSVFDAVGLQLEGNRSQRRSSANAKVPSLLTDLLFDERGDRLCPSHASKNGRRYRYYISKRLMHRANPGDTGWRLPASEIERVVIGTIATFFRDARQMVDALSLDAAPAELRRMLDRAASVAMRLEDEQTTDRRPLLLQLVTRAHLEETALRLDLSRAGVLRAIQPDGKPLIEIEGSLSLTAPIQLARRGVETKLVLGNAPATASPDRAMIAAIADAHRWLGQLASGEVGSIDQIAVCDNVDASDVGRLLPLAFLAPDLIQAILAGTQPVELTARRLKRVGALPLCWGGQRQLLGFHA
ncbi:MAG: recombinase family protein [Rhodospirillales bacterium]|nr:recombinase family protein [Rhodospirillales bacterium]